MPTLAGDLEKCSRWKKEWEVRFFVLRQHHLDYYMAPPIDIDEAPRGSIGLKNLELAEELGRPYCLRIGGHRLSCKSQAEQRRWWEALSQAALSTSSTCGSFSTDSISEALSEHGSAWQLRQRGRSNTAPAAACGALCRDTEVLGFPKLLLLLPEGPPRALPWRERITVPLFRGSQATVMLLDDQGRASSMCQLPPVGKKAGGGEFSVALKPLAAAGGKEGKALQDRLVVQIYHPEAEAQGGVWVAASCVCFLAVWLMAGAVAILAVLNTAAGVAGFSMWTGLWCPSVLRRQLGFSVDRIEHAKGLEVTPALPPLWVGRWKLDRSRSDLMAPILEDMGVNFILRKAADSIKSGLDIKINAANEVVIGVVTFATVEDSLPLDGSWVAKSAPPGSRIKGTVRARVPRYTPREFVLFTEFPGDEADMTDTLSVHEDGMAFTRTVERNGIVIRRTFVRER